MSWTDTSGNFWLFSGFGYDSSFSLVYGELNDLWRYNPGAGEWTWIAGNSTLPSCTAACGYAGVYGVKGTPSTSNLPGSRESGFVWTDPEGNFWLFGGIGFDANGNQGNLNDLWEFNPTNSEWTWVAGPNTLPSCAAGSSCGSPGIYGTVGTSAAANVPGGRADGVAWTDNAGNLWLFGGSGFDSAGNLGALNDLWEFNTTTSQWTWVEGSKTVPASCSPYTTCGPPGVYGTKGTPSTNNIPGGRYGAVGWTDNSGNFWLFGGEVNYTYADGTNGDMEDLWRFSPSTKEWTWITGTDSPTASCNGLSKCSPSGEYGLWQTPAQSNEPGPRESSISWKDAKGNFWLFGGTGVDGVGNLGYLNDLWEFDPATANWAWMSGDTLSQESGFYGAQGVASFASTPGGRDVSVGWTDANGNLWLLGGSDPEMLGDLWKFQLDTASLSAASPPNISPSGGTYTSVQSVSITDSTPGAAIYYVVNSSMPPTQYTGPISVNASENIQAVASASGYANSSVATAKYILNLSPPPPPVFSPVPGTYYGSQVLTISDSEPYATIYYTTDGTTPTTSSPVYSNDFWVESSETVQAIAVVSGGATSSVAIGVYTILPVPPNNWAWLRGDPNNPNDNGLYGKLGLLLAQNQPGGRAGAASWTDTNGNFWFFGGYGADINGSLGYLNDIWEYQPGPQLQDGGWVWMGGSSEIPSCSAGPGYCGQSGIYGTKGEPAAANVPGGREDAVFWTDSTGNFWLFGGYGIDQSGYRTPLNDLWKFNPTTGQWAWMGGSPQSVNIFGESGTYGTVGVPAPGNIPGARYGAAAWTDLNGNFWLFGGYGTDSQNDFWLLNDVWMLNPTSNQWAWMGGTSTLSCTAPSGDGTCTPIPGVYGQIGTPAAANIPGSRFQAMAWTDPQGNFWLFGGNGFDSVGNAGNPNDLWEFSPTSNEWTWVNGSNTVPCGIDVQLGSSEACTNPPAVHGTLGVPAAGNTPPGSTAAATWVDQQGNFWLFGTNTSLDVTGNYQGWSSDMWVYYPTKNQWAWMGGDSATSNCAWTNTNDDDPTATPAYVCQGSLGVTGGEYQAGIGNLPASRSSASTWTDKQGNFWLFGGATTVPSKVIAETLQNPFSGMNDIWQFTPSTTTLPPASPPVLTLMGGSYFSGGPLSMSNGMANAKIYYTTDGTIPSSNSTLYTGSLSVTADETVSAIAVVPGYINSGIASASYLFLPKPVTPVFSPPAGTYDSAQTVSFSESAPYASMIYTTDGSSPELSTTAQTYTGPISVSSSQTIQAVAGTRGAIVTSGIANIDLAPEFSPIASATYTINTIPTATPTFSIPTGTYLSAQTVSLSDSTSGAAIYFTTDGSTPTASSNHFTAPITVSQTETIEAIAIASGYAVSAVASATYTLVPTFSLSSSASSLTISAGGQGNVTLTVTPKNGFSSAVSFACSGLPSGATCDFNPSSVTPSGGKAATSTLTIAAPTSASVARPARNPFLPAAGLAFASCLLSFTRRRALRLWLVPLAAFAVFSALSACGGGGSSGAGGGGGGGGGGQSTTATVTVTATSGSINQSTQITLTVN